MSFYMPPIPTYTTNLGKKKGTYIYLTLAGSSLDKLAIKGACSLTRTMTIRNLMNTAFFVSGNGCL
jgi:hypothetical protein